MRGLIVLACFFVLLSGSMEIVQPDLKSEGAVATHGPSEFTGEMTMISRRLCAAASPSPESL